MGYHTPESFVLSIYMQAVREICGEFRGQNQAATTRAVAARRGLRGYLRPPKPPPRELPPNPPLLEPPKLPREPPPNPPPREEEPERKLPPKPPLEPPEGRPPKVPPPLGPRFPDPPNPPEPFGGGGGGGVGGRQFLRYQLEWGPCQKRIGRKITGGLGTP